MSLKKPVSYVLKIPAKIVMLTIKYLYQKVISPLTPSVCIYRPTCSSYMIEAIERFGLIRGGLKGVWRIMRCHPFAKGGYDPVVPDEEE